MFVDVPQAVFDDAMSTFEVLPKIVEFPKNRRVVLAEAGDDVTRLTFNTKRIGRLGDNIVAERDRLKHVIYALSAVSSCSMEAGLQDPNMTVNMSLRPIGSDDRLGMDAVLKWPESVGDFELQVIATNAMVLIANDLRMHSPRLMDGTVYAMVSRDNGITLETNPMGSCSLDTDGATYDPSKPTMELWGHNIYNHKIQLVCLAGLIAIARA